MCDKICHCTSSDCSYCRNLQRFNVGERVLVNDISVGIVVGYDVFKFKVMFEDGSEGEYSSDQLQPYFNDTDCSGK